MSRRLEIRTRMAEVQKEFSALSAEIKEIEASEKRTANKAKYQDYKFLVGTYGYTLEPEDKIREVTDEDRETAHVGLSGLVYTDFEGKSQTFRYVMMKRKEDYARVATVLQKLEAVAHLSDDKVKDKEKWIKILLGEVNEEVPADTTA
ncbi:unnamed protein product [Sphagnum balticum]